MVKIKQYSTKKQIALQSEPSNVKIQKQLNNAIELKGLIGTCENDITVIVAQYTNNETFGEKRK